MVQNVFTDIRIEPGGSVSNTAEIHYKLWKTTVVRKE